MASIPSSEPSRLGLSEANNQALVIQDPPDQFRRHPGFLAQLITSAPFVSLGSCGPDGVVDRPVRAAWVCVSDEHARWHREWSSRSNAYVENLAWNSPPSKRFAASINPTLPVKVSSSKVRLESRKLCAFFTTSRRLCRVNSILACCEASISAALAFGERPRWTIWLSSISRSRDKSGTFPIRSR